MMQYDFVKLENGCRLFWEDNGWRIYYSDEVGKCGIPV